MTHRRDCTGSEEVRRADRDWLRERFADCEITQSHGRTGQCWDNALAESFFASIKGELPAVLGSRADGPAGSSPRPAWSSTKPSSIIASLRRVSWNLTV
jgi:transposase InsO family protein